MSRLDRRTTVVILCRRLVPRFSGLNEDEAGGKLMQHFQYQPDDLHGTLFEEVLTRLQNAPRVESILRIRGLAKRQFREYFAALSRPVILEDMEPLVQDEAKVKDVLGATLGTRIVKARYGLYADPDIYVKHRPTRLVTVNDVLERLESGSGEKEHLYLANLEVSQYVARSLGVTSPRYYASSDLRAPRLWLGPTGCITPLHKDGSDNFAVHVFGRKRWLLFQVRDYPYLYMNQPNPRSIPGFASSRVDVRNPDLENFPLYRLARPIKTEIGAGDVLYLPAGWGHYVETVNASLMVNYWVSNLRRRPGCLEYGVNPETR